MKALPLMTRLLADVLRAVTILAALACHAGSTAVATGISAETVVLRGGEATTLLSLGAALQDQAIEVRLLGWIVAGAELQPGLPAGLEVVHPTVLAPTATPLLPLIVREVGPEAVPPALTLVFLLRGDRVELRVPVSVIAPGQARFAVEAPAEVVGRPEQALQIPVRVVNTGTAPARAELSFQGADATAPTVTVPAGTERTVHVSTAAPGQGSRELRIEVHGGLEPARATVRLVSTDSRRGTGGGVATTVTAEAQAALGAGMAGLDAAGTIELDGTLSRTTRLRATVQGDLDGTPEATLDLQHRGTRLELSPASATSPAGDVGFGLYLAQEVRRVSGLDQLSVGVAVPLPEQGERPSRFGVRASRRRLRASASLDTHGENPRARLEGGTGRFHAQVAYRPDEATRWKTNLTWVRPSLQLAVGYDRTDTAHEAWAASRAPFRVPGIGRTAFSVRVELMDWALREIAAGLDGADGSVRWRRIEGEHTFDARYEVRLRPVELELAAHLPFAVPASGWVRLDAGAPLGPSVLTAGATVTGTGATDARVGASYQRLLLGGLLSAETELAVQDALGSRSLSSTFGAGYVHPDGWQGGVAMAVPLQGHDRVELELSLTHRGFVATPQKLADALDGPDPTERHLTVLLFDGEHHRPLAGVRVHACGETATTDADGRAVLRGPPSRCAVRLDASTLPVASWAGGTDVELGPGEDRVVEVLTTAEVRGRVRYVDPMTGQPLDGGPRRTVRVQLDGPEARWTSVTLPEGDFVLEDLPVGAYTAEVPGGTERTFVLTGAGAEVVVSVPGPARTVLDPVRATPPVAVTLASLLVPAGGTVELRVTSPGEIARVDARWGEQRGAGQAQNGGWTVRLTAPPTEVGAHLIPVEIGFADGSVAERSVQVIVTTAPGGVATGPEVPPRPVTEMPAPRANSGPPPCPAPLADLVTLAASDDRLGVHVASTRIPTGVTVALYVSSDVPMRAATALNAHHLRSPRRWREGDRHVWQVLTVVPYNEEVQTVTIPLRVVLENGAVVERLVHLEVDDYAPIPVIPGYNAPYSPSCEGERNP